jgi:hypothetical protein
VTAARRPFTLDDARRFIDSVTWVYARTVPAHPHFYAVRDQHPLLAEDFDGFAALIRETGTVRWWPASGSTCDCAICADRRPFPVRYLTIGDWEYWGPMPPGLLNRQVGRNREGRS